MNPELIALAPAMLPALLEALGRVGGGVMVIADRGNGLELWYANAPAAVLFGQTCGELTAMLATEQIAPEQRAIVEQLLASFRAGQPVPPVIELLALTNDGTTLPVEIAIGSFPITGGTGYVGTLRSVAGHQQAPLSLLEADRIGLVGALTAGFAHEINNPLTSVVLNLRSLRKQLNAGLPASAQPQALRCLEDINTGAERIANNVRALATLATRSPTATSLDLAAVVSAALRLSAPTLEPRAHVIRQIFPVRRVVGEESRIGQAVLAMLLFSSSGFDPDANIVHNRIVVSVEQREDDVVLEVSDNGRDMTSEDTQHAFDPFYRSPARGAGVGVGLGVARSVAAALGGEVTLAARPGGGAVITMRLRTVAP
jgi:PAS domain S-box-containing protein